MGVGSSKQKTDDRDRILIAGKPAMNRCDNMITTSKYTIWSFLPVALGEQFRRFANMYFLMVGCIMAVGYYTDLYESALTPWTTLGPLAFVISVSLLVQGLADAKRHKSDNETNNFPCVILRRGHDIDHEVGAERETSILGGKDVIVTLDAPEHSTNDGPSSAAANAGKKKQAKIGFQKIRRMDIRQGHIVLVKNREMVPADMILLASSGDNGSSYIETSSIDGETNLKLRTSPHFPSKLLQHLRRGKSMKDIAESPDENNDIGIESLEQATKRVARFSTLAYPNGISAMKNPNYRPDEVHEDERQTKRSFFERMSTGVHGAAGRASIGLHNMAGRASHTLDNIVHGSGGNEDTIELLEEKYVAALKSEAPNPHVNTFSGLMVLPPIEMDESPFDIPLGAENILLRGAVVRNTEWVIGLACFTGTDTKLVQNSFETPSKFSQLDILMNKTVVFVLSIMFLCISYLASMAVISNGREFDNIWYAGLNKNTSQPWPYLQDLEAPDWTPDTQNWIQMFFLYVTLLSNFVPLSLYVTVEMCNFFLLYLVYVDVEMYDDRTDTRAVARSTNITDLGQIQYIFSDKTGTLTQNVMRFKRCSVDGMVFGAPIQKQSPGADEKEANLNTAFHPLRRVLVGQSVGGAKEEEQDGQFPSEDRMTFNSEMFLRVMSLCHTVVVEKDLDLSDNIDASKSVTSHASSTSNTKKYGKKMFGKRDRATSEMSANSAGYGLGMVAENKEADFGANRIRAQSTGSVSLVSGVQKGKDGAPLGFAYQAESPDEGALVSAASKSFGFQVVGRDSSGIKIKCAHPTIFTDEKVVEDIKNGCFSPIKLASESSSNLAPVKGSTAVIDERIRDPSAQRTEVWSILAVNKFDSDRKRMSIVLRAPAELGGFVMVLCKGADSAMLDSNVCLGTENLVSDSPRDSASLNVVNEDYDTGEEAEWALAQMLGLQAHLGEFASEGLRTLVLGVRFLTEKEAAEWLEIYKAAATSIKDRDGKLKDAAFKIECRLHIVGATAIEDKLQDGVGATIATLENAGIKLWVLTGDKRETAIEIGYSSHVLTPKMHVTEVADKGASFVRAQCAMEFMRLVKSGHLQSYQRSEVDQSDDGFSISNVLFGVGKCRRSLSRGYRRQIIYIRVCFAKILGMECAGLQEALESINKEEETEKSVLKDVVRRRHVRDRAEKTIQDFLNSPDGQIYKRKKGLDDTTASEEMTADSVPSVFAHAKSARELLQKRQSEGKLSAQEVRSLSIAQLTAHEMDADHDPNFIDEDTLSLNSFFPVTGGATSDFDKRRRTVLERLFAVDRDVRKGRLIKHLKKEKRAEALSSSQTPQEAPPATGDGPRALVIEGAALKHLLGDPELEELIFAIASSCEAVIACRVSPRQKALLVRLVRHNITPEPVTLAIGDGANDVGMIQEAHVGIGISGKEGKQAVNASDFAIAQFRFLESLILIHGRWDFFRQSIVVLFSFYKNSLMAGCLVAFNGETLYSGQPLFDQWVISSLNFVAGFPILFYGMFDRCLDKDYIRRNPEVYQASRENELITNRVLLRWILLTFMHLFVLYYGTVQLLTNGGGVSSAFKGLMVFEDRDFPGDGEGGDLQSVGTVTYSCLIFTLALKVLYESRSIINGEFPPFTCSKNSGEGFASRMAYTWLAQTFGSIIFYYFFLFMYHLIGANTGPGEFSNFVSVPHHVMSRRSVNWLIMVIVPVCAMAFDLFGKVFSNMYYPTQTQIHIEIESKERALAKKNNRRRSRRNPPSESGGTSSNKEAEQNVPASA